MEEEQNSETSLPTTSVNVYPGCGGTGWTRPIDANFENWWSGGNSDECEQCHKCSEEHKCDASLTKQLLLRLHMKDSMLCSSAVQHLIIRIRSLISTCSVAVWQNCTEGKAFSACNFFWVWACCSGMLPWYWELLPLVLGAASFS